MRAAKRAFRPNGRAYRMPSFRELLAREDAAREERLRAYESRVMVLRTCNGCSWWPCDPAAEDALDNVCPAGHLRTAPRAMEVSR